MTNKTPEQRLNDQLAICTAALQECLERTRETRTDDSYGNLRRADVDCLARLMKSVARLNESHSRLKGETRHSIHVLRGDAARGHVYRDADKGEG